VTCSDAAVSIKSSLSSPPKSRNSLMNDVVGWLHVGHLIEGDVEDPYRYCCCRAVVLLHTVNHATWKRCPQRRQQTVQADRSLILSTHPSLSPSLSFSRSTSPLRRLCARVAVRGAGSGCPVICAAKRGETMILSRRQHPPKTMMRSVEFLHRVQKGP